MPITLLQTVAQILSDVADTLVNLASFCRMHFAVNLMDVMTDACCGFCTFSLCINRKQFDDQKCMFYFRFLFIIVHKIDWIDILICLALQILDCSTPAAIMMNSLCANKLQISRGHIRHSVLIRPAPPSPYNVADKRDTGRKVRIFLRHVFNTPAVEVPLKFYEVGWVQKLEMVELPGKEKSLMRISAGSIHYHHHVYFTVTRKA